VLRIVWNDQRAHCTAVRSGLGLKHEDEYRVEHRRRDHRHHHRVVGGQRRVLHCLVPRQAIITVVVALAIFGLIKASLKSKDHDRTR
jgi:hypothetical protein